MVNPDSLHLLQTGDHIAAAAGFRIAGTGQDETDTPARPGLQQTRRQFSDSRCRDVFRQIAAKQRHHRLTFRIPKAAIVFNHLGPLRRQHQAEIKETPVGQPIPEQPGDGRLDNGALHCRHHFGGNQRRGRDRTHAAGVRTFIPIPHPLVIAGRGEDLVVPIHDGTEDRQFRSCQAFLHHHASRAELPLHQHRLQKGFRLRHGLANRHALPCGQAVEFQHHGHRRHRRTGFLNRIHRPITGRRNAMPHEKLFGEFLARLQLG